MPVVTTTDVLKVTFGGTAWTDQEIWSIGMHLGMEDGSTVATAFEDLDLAALHTAFVTNLMVEGYPSLATSVLFGEVRLGLYNQYGQLVGDSRNYFGPSYGSGLDDSSYIPQHSVVVSLLSDLPRGKTAKGRFYLPAGFGLPDADGYISNTDRANVITQVEAFLNAVSDVATSADPDLRIVNFSAGTALVDAILNPVVSFRIGNVVDTQRRRRNGLRERYAGADLA